MRFCTNCGAQIPDGTKFCTECGMPAAQEPAPVRQDPEPAQPVYQAPVQNNAPETQQYYGGYSQTNPQQNPEPAQPVYQAPVQNEAPVTQQNYGGYSQTNPQPVQQNGGAYPQAGTPQQGYGAPAQTYAPPTQPTYAPPAQPDGSGAWVPPTTPGDAPKQKKPGSGKKIALFVGIGVVVVALVVLLVVLLGQDKTEDSNLGRYECVSCVFYDMDLGADGEWIELKAKGKAVISLLFEEYDAEWELDGETLTVKSDGDTYEGTLKDGVIVLDLDGMVYTFAKDGATVEASTGGETKLSEAGYWTLLRVDGGSEYMGMGEEDVATLKDLGIEFFLSLNEDGTAVVMLDTPQHATWESGTITAETGETLSYWLEDDLMHMDVEGADFVFTRGEGTAPDIDWSLYEGYGETPTENSGTATDAYDWWGGKWYGWMVIFNGSDAYADDIDSCVDCTAQIDVYGESGYVELLSLDGDILGWAGVSFGAGTTENGCMLSESGYLFDQELSYADWLIDPGASIVSEFQDMICIDGTIYDENGEWFDYYIFLRPWGMVWEDVREADTSNMPYSDMMPIYYDDWYLPQLESGAPIEEDTSVG